MPQDTEHLSESNCKLLGQCAWVSGSHSEARIGLDRWYYWVEKIPTRFSVKAGTNYAVTIPRIKEYLKRKEEEK